MRGYGLLALGLMAIVVGVVGLFIVTPAVTAPQGQGAWGPGGMMGGAQMSGMMGGPVDSSATPIGMDRASSAAGNYVAGFNNPNLQLGEVMEFASNYYAQVVEKDTGVHAFELLVDKNSGAVFPEMGPNMAWNTKYGMMGGMMGGGRGFGQTASPKMSVSPEQAQALARQYLKNQGLPLDVDMPDQFYGYYTLHTLRDGAVEGMLSVNGYTGEIWYHTWHGPFIREQQPTAVGDRR